MLTLIRPMAEKSKTLTLKLDLDTLAEFSVSAHIHRARSVSSFLHEYVVRQINEARRMIPAEEFDRRVAEQKAAIEARSAVKQKERVRTLANKHDVTARPTGMRLTDGSPHKLGVHRNSKEVTKKKRAG